MNIFWLKSGGAKAPPAPPAPPSLQKLDLPLGYFYNGLQVLQLEFQPRNKITLIYRFTDYIYLSNLFIAFNGCCFFFFFYYVVIFNLGIIVLN